MLGFKKVDGYDGGTQPASYLDTLQQAKQLFLKENFNAAIIRFEEFGRITMGTAPDLWIDAIYGLAECQRLERDFLNAAENYRRLLQFGSSRRDFKGRLEESNRIAIIQSFLAMSDIGRLSIRVSTPLLEEFTNYGFRWTLQEVGENAASLSFGLARLLLKRNINGPAFILDNMLKLLKKLKSDNREWLPIDSYIVELKLLETKLDAGLSDNTTSNYLENIHQQISHALYELGDLSTPFWHLINLLLLYLKSSKILNADIVDCKRFHKNILSNLLSILNDLLNTHWLLDVLLSRDISYNTINHVRLWSRAEKYSNKWLKTGKTLLNTLSRAIRP